MKHKFTIPVIFFSFQQIFLFAMLFVNLLMLFCWCCKFAFLLVFVFFSRNISYQQHCQRCKSSHSIMYCLYQIVGIVLLSSPTASFTLPLISLYPPLPPQYTQTQINKQTNKHKHRSIYQHCNLHKRVSKENQPWQ